MSMKKIYLIDDNVDGNRRKYGAGFVDEGAYHDVIVAIEKLSPKDDLSFLKNASCILLHKSFEDFIDGKFHDDSHIVAKLIIQMPWVGNNIPLVLFSDGDTNDLGVFKDQTIYSLKKRAFYSRLESFILHYKEANEIDLKILAYDGDNYIKYLANRFVTSLFVSLQDLSNDELLLAQKVHNEYFEQLVSLSQPSLGKTYREIIVDLTLNPITVGDFRYRINRILENIQDYGKNYFTWK